MYPENLSHHIRQWTRWMRGTTLRTFWRLRYLPIASWGWLYTLLTLWWYLASLAITVVLAADLARVTSYTATMVATGVLWAWAMGSRLLVVDRSDQSFVGRAGAAAMAPVAAFWVMAVLRFVRNLRHLHVPASGLDHAQPGGGAGRAGHRGEDRPGETR